MHSKVVKFDHLKFDGLRDREVLRGRCVRAVGAWGEVRRKEAKSIGLTPYPVLCRPFQATLCHNGNKKNENVTNN